jgi:hypothetical protein
MALPDNFQPDILKRAAQDALRKGADMLTDDPPSPPLESPLESPPESEWVKVDVNELDEVNHAGEKWGATKAIKTNQSLVKDLMAQVTYIIPRMRKELKTALEELEEARTTAVVSNKELLAGFKALPTKDDLVDIRQWVSAD